MHTGDAEIAAAPMTTDADLAIDVERVAAAPELATAIERRNTSARPRLGTVESGETRQEDRAVYVRTETFFGASFGCLTMRVAIRPSDRPGRVSPRTALTGGRDVGRMADVSLGPAEATSRPAPLK